MEEEVLTPEYFLNLPIEVQQKIAIDLDVESILNLCQSSKMIESGLCADDTFWREKHYRDFGRLQAPGAFTWFESYKVNSLGILDFQIDQEAGSGKWLKIKVLESPIIYIPLFDNIKDISDEKINVEELLSQSEFSIILYDLEDGQVQLARLEDEDGYLILSDLFIVELKRSEVIRLINELNKYL